MTLERPKNSKEREVDIDIDIERLFALKGDLSDVRAKGGVAEFIEAADNPLNQVAEKVEKDADDNQVITQQDGLVIRIKKDHRYNLSFLREAEFFDKNGGSVFKLSEIIPEGYVLVEGSPIGRDFMSLHYKYIILEENCFQSVIGRFFALHEIGHATDFTHNPVMGSELSLLEDEIQLSREVSAWELAKGLIEELKQKGVSLFPESFFDSGEFERLVNFCLDHHKSLIKK